MPRLQFGISAFERERGNLPGLPVVNMFAEQAPTEEGGVILQSRPGLEVFFTTGDEPITAAFVGDSVLGSSGFFVSGVDLYSGSDFCGTMDGDGPFSICGYQALIFVAGGGQLWGFNGVTLAAIAFPDSANVLKVVMGASRAICIRADTEKFYWSDPLSDTIDALSFATAESQPDRLRDMLFIDDVLILFGAETVEFWPNTGDADLPFQPLEGRVFERGIKGTGCAVQYNSSFAWVTNTNNICLSDPENIISPPWLQAKIESSTDVSLWTFFLEGTEYLALRLDAETWVFSSGSTMWSEMQSYGETNWLAGCYAGGLFGSAVNGDVYRWTSGHADFGGVMERRFRAGVPLNSGCVTVDNLILRANPGNTPYLTGDYIEPVVEMRTSRDVGTTFGNWRSRSLGEQGDYRKKLQWTGCGMFGQPGFVAEFRVTDPIDLRVSDVLINEPYGAL